jgi:RecB family exonuclease
VIHDVLEHVETAAQARGESHGTAEEAVEAIDQFFDPAEFGGEPWATGWRRRAEFILRRLYELWPGKGPAIALEHEVTDELDGVAWLGRVDRIERRGDSAWVIDYKTGTSTPKVADAATSLQLGFYARAIDDIEVGGAEMWFPADKGSVNITKRTFDMANLGHVETGMRDAQNGIIGEAWEPRPGTHCETCRHRILCPAWPEGAEAYSS